MVILFYKLGNEIYGIMNSIEKTYLHILMTHIKKIIITFFIGALTIIPFHQTFSWSSLQSIAYFEIDEKATAQKQKLVLRWSAQNVDGCSGVDGEEGSSKELATRGSLEFSFPKKSTKYTLLCHTKYGNSTQSVGRIIYLDIGDSSVVSHPVDWAAEHYLLMKKPGKIHLEWDVDEVTECLFYGNGIKKNVDPVGQLSIRIPHFANYELRCNGPNLGYEKQYSIRILARSLLKPIRSAPKKVQHIKMILSGEITKIPWTGDDLSGDVEDYDSDGLSNQFEWAWGLDNDELDNDHDGYSDRKELLNGYNPLGGGKLIFDTSLLKRSRNTLYFEKGMWSDYYLWHGRADGAITFLGGISITKNDLKNILKKRGIPLTKKQMGEADRIIKEQRQGLGIQKQKKDFIFTSQPTSISSIFEKVTLSWDSKDIHGSYCTADGGWSGRKNPSGTEEVYGFFFPTFDLVCYTEDGSGVKKSLTINDDAVPLDEKGTNPQVAMIATPTTIQVGEPVTVSWDAKGADNCAILAQRDDWNEERVAGITGSRVIHPKSSGQFQINCDKYTKGVHYAGFGAVNITVK